eukprot:15333392-Ditylum_brightwellii.AAC.1
MPTFNILQAFACKWRSNKEITFKVVFERKRTDLIRSDANANTILVADDSGVEISDDIAFICGDQLRKVVSYVFTTIPRSLRHIALRRRYYFLPASLEPCYREESLDTKLVSWSAFERM